MPYPIDWEKLLVFFRYEPHSPLIFGSNLFLPFLFFSLLACFLFRKNTTARVYSIILFSAFFYYKAAGTFVFLLILLVVLNYYLGNLLFFLKSEKNKRIIFYLSILINIGLLIYFKYTNFFIQILNNINFASFDTFDIIFPIGISFFTFKSLGYIIEIYLGFVEPVQKFRDFALFIFFFPSLLMGPIDRASHFLTQINQEYKVSNKQVGLAVFLLCSGLLKKFVVADYLALNFTNRVFDFPLRFTGVENLLAVYASAMQSYSDFSGYTDMALGTGLLFGFQLMENFNRPFKADSIVDFWKRWHLTLSNWLLDFLFKPLQVQWRGLRKFGTVLAIIVTFFCVGLWHGPKWTFITFGLLHSFYIIFSMHTQKHRSRFYDRLGIRNSKIFRIFQVFFTFHLLVFTAILFRVPSLTQALDIFKQIFTFFQVGVFTQFVASYPEIFFLVIVSYIFHFLPDRLEQKTKEIMGKTSLAGLAIILSIVIFIVLQVTYSGMLPFIYFKF